MSELKSHEFGGFLQRSVRDSRVFLIYGPDRGLVSERAVALAGKTGVPPDDPFAVTRIDASSLQGDPGRLLDEVNALGLFGGEKLVWLRCSGTEKPLLDAMQVLAKDPPQSCWLIIEAGDLKKTAGLRKTVEGTRGMVAIPCYADDGRALNQLIDSELANEGLTITPDARHRLLESIGGDRLATRGEIAKLALYCKGQARVEEQDVLDIIGDASAISADDAVDAVLKGDRNGFHHAMDKIIHSKTPVFLVLQGCLRQFQLMDIMRAEMDEKRVSPSQVLQTLGRHLHFRRKPILENALNVWTGPAIAREMDRLQAAIFNSRQRQSLQDSIALHTLLSITLQSGRKT